MDGMAASWCGTFEEFAYRFWLEGRISRYLDEPVGPMPEEFRRYLAHDSPSYQA